MAGTSYNPYVALDVEEEEYYPYPSNVCSQHFVTVKLSGRDKYNIWKTQMICLLESHGMLGFINGTYTSPDQKSVLGKEKEGDYMLWRRSDSLVKGWILGSVSEKALRHVVKTNEDVCAKHVWDKLQSIYGPVLDQHPSRNSVFEDTILDHESKKGETEITQMENEEEGKERAHLIQRLYEAIISQSFEDVCSILKDKKVKITDKITINGNTPLHVAVGTTKNIEFIKKMLGLIDDQSTNTLLDMRNSDGSTLLHIAAIVGNTNAAALLVQRNKDLVTAVDNDGDTPLNKALSNMNSETYKLLFNPEIHMNSLFDGKRGEELIVNAISCKDYHSALMYSKDYRNLHSDVVLMAIAQNFPMELNSWERRANKFTRNSEAIKTIILWMIYLVLIWFYFLGMGVIYPRIRSYKWAWASFLIEDVLIYICSLLIVGVWKFRSINERKQMHDDANKLLKHICMLIKESHTSKSHYSYYINPLFEATKQNAYEVVVTIVSFFPNAIWSTNEDGHNIIQYAVVNRSEKIYNLLYQMSEHKNIYKTIRDSFGNNLLHLAAILAPTNKLNTISGAPLQIQRELQWFKVVEGFVCPLNTIQKNELQDTPQMVFSREHKDLVIEGEKWMKSTAKSYTIASALIATIVFAAAITVPGGNNEVTGVPIFTKKNAFLVFKISDTISLYSSLTSLLMFLSILTARFAEMDFLFKLPTQLIIGLVALLISTTAMIVAFGATVYMMFAKSNPWILLPIGLFTCLPITCFVSLQFTLIADLVSSTYGRSIFRKERNDPFY